MASDPRYDRFLGVQFDTYLDALAAFCLVFGRKPYEAEEDMLRSRVKPAAHEDGDAHLAQSINNLGETVGNISARVAELEAALKGIGVEKDEAAGNGAGGYVLKVKNGIISGMGAIKQADIENLTVHANDTFAKGNAALLEQVDYLTAALAKVNDVAKEKQARLLELQRWNVARMREMIQCEIEKPKAFDAQANNPVEGSAAELSARIVEAMNLINSEELNNLDSLCAHDKDTLQRIISAVKRALVA